MLHEKRTDVNFVFLSFDILLNLAEDLKFDKSDEDIVSFQEGAESLSDSDRELLLSSVSSFKKFFLSLPLIDMLNARNAGYLTCVAIPDNGNEVNDFGDKNKDYSFIGSLCRIYISFLSTRYFNKSNFSGRKKTYESLSNADRINIIADGGYEIYAMIRSMIECGMDIESVFPGISESIYCHSILHPFKKKYNDYCDNHHAKIVEAQRANS